MPRATARSWPARRSAGGAPRVISPGRRRSLRAPPPAPPPAPPRRNGARSAGGAGAARGRPSLGAAGAERLVQAALPVRVAGLLGQFAEGPPRRRPVPAPPHQSRAWLRAEGPLALSRARLGGGGGRICLRAAGRDPHAGGSRGRGGNDHAVP